MKKTRMIRLLSGVIVSIVASVASGASEGMPVLSPEKPGAFSYLADPTPESIQKAVAAGRRVLVASHTFGHEEIDFNAWAETVSAVAFDCLPRAHLLHSWKGLGVTVLKTVNFDREGTVGRFRREAGFLAFLEGADGIWVPELAVLPENWRRALGEALEDRRILDYLATLRDRAAGHADASVRIEARRVTFFFAWLPATWENLDRLRLECVGWAKRLEQLMGVKPAKLPTAVPPPVEPAGAGFKPYDGRFRDAEAVKVDVACKDVPLGEGLFFSANEKGFSLSFAVTNKADVADWKSPGRALDFRVYVNVPGRAGEFLPYRFHCDLDPMWTGPRAPARGRGSFLYATDERFRPYGIGWGVANPRMWAWPQPRDYGPDYPDPRAGYAFSEDKKTGGWRATINVGWLSLWGFGPAETDNKTDVWCVGLDRSPVTGRAVICRLVWPRGKALNRRKRLLALSPREMTAAYSEQLARTSVWGVSNAERYYPFAKTAAPCFHLYDLESDRMFLERIVNPLKAAQADRWNAFHEDKDHKPKYPGLPEATRLKIAESLGEMLFLSFRVGELRRDYLAGRYLGKEPPIPAKPKQDAVDVRAVKTPDADFDADAIQLDDKEF